MIGALLVLSVFIVVGIACILFPRKIQKYLIRTWGLWLPRWFKFPSRTYIEGPLYIWYLRLIGLFALAVGMYFIFDLLKGL